MTDTHILDNLVSNNQILDVVSNRLDRLNTMFFTAGPGDIATTSDGFVVKENMKCVTIHQDEDVTIILAEWALKGDRWPAHKHNESIEYIVVTSGSLSIKIGGTPRIMKKGECASIPLGVVHICDALEDNTRVVGICIPPEKAYIAEKICQTYQGKS